MILALYGECVRQIENPCTNVGVCREDNKDRVRPRLKSRWWRCSAEFPDGWIGVVWSMKELQVVITAIGVYLQCKVCKVHLKTQNTSNIV
ncbi:hypothetical protein DPMN_067246 [Dreissena polymorpha]|uniref:Uncharacterized protein n=1 Tax=Dreissena polymorpha TaxID=45954 RepID=A0A9D3YZD1_DREPO|nr:hypothetical protein DPMN_067246 [Dreissena polymorpha]